MSATGLMNMALDGASKLLTTLPGVQEKARARVVRDLQTVCGNCADAYAVVLARLEPVQAAYGAPRRLAAELRKFAADAATRARFKPEGLCSQVDQLLVDLQSLLNPVRYSWGREQVAILRDSLKQLKNVDGALFDEYDRFSMELRRLADELGRANGVRAKQLTAQAAGTVDYFVANLSAAVRQAQMAKVRVFSPSIDSR